MVLLSLPVTHSIYLAPQATSLIFNLDKASTILGFCSSVSSPCPSLLFVPSPHVYKSHDSAGIVAIKSKNNKKRYFPFTNGKVKKNKNKYS